MKTALQQLIEHLDPIHSGIKQKAEELLEVEKEQIMKANIDGYVEAQNYGETSAEQYYNETYTK